MKKIILSFYISIFLLPINNIYGKEGNIKPKTNNIDISWFDCKKAINLKSKEAKSYLKQHCTSFSNYTNYNRFNPLGVDALPTKDLIVVIDIPKVINNLELKIKIEKGLPKCT